MNQLFGGNNMRFKITFEYRDEMSKGKWRRQTCIMSSVAECKKVYGLGIDCEYRIIEIEQVP
jgi:hypothetical protein